MAENEGPKDPAKLSVELNEAFERLEKQQEENLRTESSGSEARATPRAKRTEAQSRPASSGTGLISGLGIVLSLIALGVGSYAVFLLQTPVEDPAVARMDDRLAAMEQRVDANLNQMEDVYTRLDSITAALASTDPLTEEDLAAFKREVDASVMAIRDQMGTSSQDWLLAEVEYLLRLGAQRVIMEGDTRGALALFRAADDIVRDAEGIAAFELRRAIASDIAQLEAVANVDVDGIFVRLEALVGQVSRLLQKEQKFETTMITAEVPAPAPEAGVGARILAFLGSAGDRLAGLVDYRSDGDRVAPILPPREEYYLRQNLVLKLQIAQLGLLRADNTVYTNSLTEAQGWLANYFDVDDPATIAMDRALGELAALDVQANMPEVTDSLLEVRKLLTRFHQEEKRELSEE